MFYRGVGNISANEAIIYNHWTVMFTLLKENIPWEYIQGLSESEIAIMLAVLTVQKDREFEAQMKLNGLGR